MTVETEPASVEYLRSAHYRRYQGICPGPRVFHTADIRLAETLYRDALGFSKVSRLRRAAAVAERKRDEFERIGTYPLGANFARETAHNLDGAYTRLLAALAAETGGAR